MAAPQSSPAFLLKSNALGESDRLLVFYTRNEGKIRGVARGAQKSRRRFGAALDWFHLLKLGFRSGRGELLNFDQVELIERSSRIVLDMSRYTLGSYFLELVRELTQDHHPDAEVFDLLHATLRTLESGTTAYGPLARYFELRLLDLLGFRPAVDSCVECRTSTADPETTTASIRFSISRGGLVCDRCSQKKSFFGPLLTLSTATYRLMHTPDVTQSLSPPDNRQLSRLITDFITYHTQKRMKSITVMAGAL